MNMDDAFLRKAEEAREASRTPETERDVAALYFPVDGGAAELRIFALSGGGYRAELVEADGRIRMFVMGEPDGLRAKLFSDT